MSGWQRYRQFLNQNRVGDVATIIGRYRAQRLAIQPAFCGGLGTDINVKVIPENVVPWRRLGMCALMQVTWALTLRAVIYVQIANLVVVLLAFVRFSLIDAIVVHLGNTFSRLTTLIPVGDRLWQESNSGKPDLVFAYWSFGLLLLFAASIVIALANFAEFWSHPRAITAITLDVVDGWQAFLNRAVVAAVTFGGLCYSLFISDLLGFYPDAYGGHISNRTLGGALLIDALQTGSIFLVPFILTIFLMISVILCEAFARVVRKIARIKTRWAYSRGRSPKSVDHQR